MQILSFILSLSPSFERDDVNHFNFVLPRFFSKLQDNIAERGTGLLLYMCVLTAGAESKKKKKENDKKGSQK